MLRFRQQRRDAGDVSGRGLGFRRRSRANALGPGPGLQHRFHRYAKIGRPPRRALRKFAGAHDTLVERCDRCGLQRDFDDRFDQPLRAADHVQVAIPLRAGIEFGLAIAERFPGHHQHGCLHGACAIDRHAALQKARAGVQQHGLHAAGHLRVSGRHGHRDRLVTAIQIGRPRACRSAFAAPAPPRTTATPSPATKSHSRPLRLRNASRMASPPSWAFLWMFVTTPGSAFR